MEASHGPEGRKVLKTTINNLEYLYDGENVTCFGHKFMELCLGDDNRNRPVEFWKAQLAFRGFSPRGNDIKALKQRLVNSNTVQPDTMVKQGIQKMMRAYRKKDRENEEPVHQARQARHVEEGDREEYEDSDEEPLEDNEEENNGEGEDDEGEDDEGEDDEGENGAETDKDSEEYDNDADDSDEELNDGPWDITGHWELECKTMSSNYSQSKSYTFDIFSAPRGQARQVFGRFNLGKFKGIIRFARGRNSADRNEYLLNQQFDPWTADNTRLYRWRGKDCQDIIQLGSDSRSYTMTFSRGVKRVNGVWGTHDGDPGTVEFTGRKVSEEDIFSGSGILHEWTNHNQHAYDAANRARWR
ncbi:uncharacterized protein EAF02_011683 [Botrytis sinoallii]|uniref:uncharacterized protein n=1 Tax=Botrytis sinoallii TaxID=1463999 RepID=UPI0019021815|nr:uncharacterized protein EAF02_011683 [Botrytis sinoallii]KAF7854508.1 hypothetical protein EAF02_011683 [Botrytis sinoallii]